MAVAVFFSFTGFPAKHPNVFRGILFDPAPAGWDLTTFARFTHRVNGVIPLHGPGRDEQFNYGPLSVFVFAWILGEFPDPYLAFIAVVSVSAAIAAIFLGRAIWPSRLGITAVLAAAITSYPFLLLCDRGNVEGIIWAVTAGAFFLFVKKRYLTAALAFAVAASLKPFPALFFLLFLPIGRYREFFAGIGAACLITAASLAAIGPSLAAAFRQLLLGFRLAQERYVTIYRPYEIGNDHSLFALYKQCLRMAKGWAEPASLTGTLIEAYPFYAVCAAAILGVSLFRLRKFPALNQIFGLSVLSILLPPYNYDYTLVTMYIPWSILLIGLTQMNSSLPRQASSWLMVFCALLFTTQYYLLFGTTAAFGGQVKAITLVAILISVQIYPLPMAMFGDHRETAR